MANSSLPKKLLIKPGQRIVIVNAPPGYLDGLGPLPEGVAPADEPDGTFDFVQLFVKNVAELDRLAPTAIGVARRDALLWICYPKRSSRVVTDITRDVGWDSVKKAGLEPVSMVAIDDTWSALRFRPADLVVRSRKG
ncbi:MAG: hypothetical protein HYY30_04395 [Chloroflexi bacterium]|nr:hypothetical protein [Chloroflexota bacterium]